MNATNTSGSRRAWFLAPPIIVSVAAITGAVLVGVLSARYALLVFVAAFLVAAWVVLAKHYVAALAILLVGFFVYPTVLGLAGEGTSSARTAVFYGLLATAALAGGIARHPDALRIILWRRGTQVGLLLAAWTVASFMTFSLDNDLALKRLGFMAFFMIIPLIAGQFVTEKELQRFYWFCVGLISLGTVLTISNLLGADMASESRISVDKNASPLGFAYSTGLVAFMSLALLTGSKVSNGQRLLLWAQLVGTAVVIIASGSRGPIVALAAGIVVLLFRSSRRARAYTLAAVAVGALAAWLTLPLVPTVVYNRLASVVLASSTGGLDAAFADSRGDLWLLSLSAWQSSPLFGIGLGNFVQYGQDIASFSHNFVLEALTELGLVGLLILGMFLWIVGRSALGMMRQNETSALRLSLVALLAYTVVSMSFSGQLQASVDFWMVSAFVISLSVQQEHPAHAPGEADWQGRRGRLAQGHH